MGGWVECMYDIIMVCYLMCKVDCVKIEKGVWGWEVVYNMVFIMYNDFLVVNVVFMVGSLFRFNKKCVKLNKRVY